MTARRGAAPNPHLFEINTWPWLDALSRRHGRRLTLGDVPHAEWDALAALGIDLVYLMGLWRRSPLGRQLARSDPRLFASYDRALQIKGEHAGLLNRQLGRIEYQFGVGGPFVWIVDAGEVLDLASAGLGVETLLVAPLAYFKRRGDMNLDEVDAQPAHELARLFVW